MKENTKKIIGATATPLASIFGSGFLVIVPILNGAVGPYSLFAMIAVCALAYAVGCVIRYNIRHAEPLLENGQVPKRIKDAIPVDLQTWQQRPGKERFMENLARLASPLL